MVVDDGFERFKDVEYGMREAKDNFGDLDVSSIGSPEANLSVASLLSLPV